MLSVTSSVIPLTTAVICYSSGLFWVDLVGQFLNGGIQTYLGYRIGKKNSQILLGRSLSSKDCENLLNIILKRKDIELAENLKNSWSIDQLRISAELKLNEKIIAAYILKIMEKDIKSIDVDQHEFEQLIKKFIYFTVSRSTEICKETEEKVKEVYEFANIIDIEKADNTENVGKRRVIERIMTEVLESQNK